MKLELSKIEKSYDTEEAVLRGISFLSERPEFISVVGSSGAGKTTLFRILNGSLRPDAGAVLVDGEDLTALPRRRRRQIQRHIGTIYQDFCLVESVSCIDNVLNASLPELGLLRGMFGIFGKARREEALRLLERVGLGDKPEEPVKNLSGGQKQRVAIARALMQHPKLLLADEPVASLDPVTGRHILALLRELQQSEQLTVLMNSHNPELAAEFSDRLLGIRDGTAVWDLPAAEMTPERLREIYSGSGESEP